MIIKSKNFNSKSGQAVIMKCNIIPVYGYQLKIGKIKTFTFVFVPMLNGSIGIIVMYLTF
jgi:hypothetical protein